VNKRLVHYKAVYFIVSKERFMHCYCVTHHGQPLEDVEKEIPQLKGTEVLLHVKAAVYAIRIYTYGKVIMI
jgi:hypothetical protein